MKKTTPLIIPTIGRIVWFNAGRSQPYAAIVAHVFSDDVVNLGVTSHLGVQYSATSVIFHHGDVNDCPEGQCCWMPYQKKQAEKAAAEEEDSAKADAAEKLHQS